MARPKKNLNASKAPKLEKLKKHRSPKLRAEKPLPPPIELPTMATEGQADPFQLDGILKSGPQGSGSSFASSSTSEPKPAEPLSAEAEQILSSLPDPGGAEAEPNVEPTAAEEIAALMPDITFDPVKVRRYLIEIFDWAAVKFDSAHWKLTETQSDMLAEPTAQLLGGIWTNLSKFLPDILTSTPGATAFMLACSFVVAPKVAQQMAISRMRRQGFNHQRKKPAGPVAVPHRTEPGPVGPIAGPAEPLKA